MEKKCPNCKQWTSWQGNLTDACLHCDTLLQQSIAAERDVWLARESEIKKNDFFIPKETDGPLMLATRKVALFFHIVFGAIAWFFIWMFVNVAG
jgi:hypothetical protein